MFPLPTRFFHVAWILAGLALSPGTFAASPVPGGVYVWQAPAGVSQVTFKGKPVMRLGDTVFVGLPITMQSGQTQLEYQLAGQTKTHQFEVEDKQYTEQHITIADKAMVDPPAETLQRIRSESVRQRGLYNSFNPPTDLTEGFALPLEGVTTSLYGHRRYFNGQPRSPHSGLDIAAPTGTPIKAAGKGTIILADDLYFNGNTLFVDHGQGLITMYCHMSELLVAEGDEVDQGQVIGRVGATGRVTGPHLHWSVSLNGTRVDPSVFLQALNATVSRTPATSSSSGSFDGE